MWLFRCARGLQRSTRPCLHLNPRARVHERRRLGGRGRFSGALTRWWWCWWGGGCDVVSEILARGENCLFSFKILRGLTSKSPRRELAKLLRSVCRYLAEKCSCLRASLEAKVGNGELAKCSPARLLLCLFGQVSIKADVFFSLPFSPNSKRHSGACTFRSPLFSSPSRRLYQTGC